MNVGVYTFQLLVHPIDHPHTRHFLDESEFLRARLDGVPGFVRWVDGAGEAPPPLPQAAGLGGTPKFTLSFWTDLPSAFAYTYRRPDHFHRMGPLRRQVRKDVAYPNHVLWWIEAARVATAHGPSLLAEAVERYNLLAEVGPTPQAFEFKHLFDPDGRAIDFLAFRRSATLPP
jgi:hypothetical protein